MRKKMVVLVSRIDGKRAVHFTKQPLAGSDNNTWFPIYNEDLFRAIENILVTNRQAINVTCITQIRETTTDNYDYEVLYNTDK